MEFPSSQKCQGMQCFEQSNEALLRELIKHLLLLVVYLSPQYIELDPVTLVFRHTDILKNFKICILDQCQLKHAS